MMIKFQKATDKEFYRGQAWIELHFSSSNDGTLFGV